MLHILYKNLGETPLQCLERLNLKGATYAGRLDPMAEGVLLALSGDTVHEKEKYLGLSKTYEVEILWGFETDSLDVLGKVIYIGSPDNKFSRSSDSWVPTQPDLENLLSGEPRVFKQKYPTYSSKNIKLVLEGKSEGVKTTEHEVEIFSAEYVARGILASKELLQTIEQKISLVSGDFRQAEILEKWRNIFMSKVPFDTKFVVDKIKLEVSSGFYVRQFVADLAREHGTVATTYHIKRTAVGDFHM